MTVNLVGGAPSSSLSTLSLMSLISPGSSNANAATRRSLSGPRKTFSIPRASSVRASGRRRGSTGGSSGETYDVDATGASASSSSHRSV